MTTDGKASASDASIPPGTPAVLKPAKVDMLMPIGPGVDSDTAIMSAMSAWENQPVLSDISYRKGSVARPPPTEKSPVFMNSNIRRSSVTCPHLPS